MVTASAAAILRRAAALIQERGWVQGRTEDEDGLALHGAIALALEEAGDESDEGWNSAMRFLEQETKTGTWLYNDHPSRSKEEVLAVLEQAAQRAEHEE